MNSNRRIRFTFYVSRFTRKVIPLKNLWWKEWRETRGLMMAGIVSIFGLFTVMAVSDLWGIGRVVSAHWQGAMMSFVVLLPLFAALSAAGRFAGEAQTGTLSFLLSQPVSLWRVWAVKATVTFLSVIPLGVLAALLYAAARAWFPQGSPDDWSLGMRFPKDYGLTPDDVFTCSCGMFATFAVIPITLLLSALLDKPSLSAMGGLAGTAAVSLWATRTAQWMFRRGDELSVMTWGEAGVAWTLMLTIGALCLAGSAMVFTRRKRVHGFMGSWVHGVNGDANTRTREDAKTR